MMGVKPIFETPFERRGILTPGLPILPHGVERHPVPGGGSRAVPVFKGDEISVLDREGLQRGELVFFAPDGSSKAGMLGANCAGRPADTISVLAIGSRSGSRHSSWRWSQPPAGPAPGLCFGSCVLRFLPGRWRPLPHSPLTAWHWPRGFHSPRPALWRRWSCRRWDFSRCSL